MRIILLIITYLPLFAHAQIKVDRDRLYNLLTEGKTQEVLAEALRLREKVYGKCALIDYFIAKSLCIDRHYEKSEECFRYILKHYQLLNDSRAFIESELTNCRRTMGTSAASSANILNIPLPSAGVSGPLGKMGFVDCDDSLKIPDYSELKSDTVLESRLFEFDKREAALEKIRGMLGSQYSVTEFHQFILVFLKSQRVNESKALKVAESLKKAYNFYISQYELRKPDKYITVYLMPDFPSLKKVAKTIHNVDLPKQTLGYSILSDLSLLGIANPDPNDIGTLYHELWHLIVRTDAGDISPWLDEGIASLYSTARWKNDTLHGEATWRTRELEQATHSRHNLLRHANLRDFLTLDWKQFNGGQNSNFCQASINYALANHLMLFLQERNVLQKVVKEVKNRDAPVNVRDRRKENDIRVLERIFDRSIDTIQSDYDRWFKSKYYFSPFKKLF